MAEDSRSGRGNASANSNRQGSREALNQPTGDVGASRQEERTPGQDSRPVDTSLQERSGANQPPRETLQDDNRDTREVRGNTPQENRDEQSRDEDGNEVRQQGEGREQSGESPESRDGGISSDEAVTNEGGEFNANGEESPSIEPNQQEKEAGDRGASEQLEATGSPDTPQTSSPERNETDGRPATDNPGDSNAGGDSSEGTVDASLNSEVSNPRGNTTSVGEESGRPNETLPSQAGGNTASPSQEFTTPGDSPDNAPRGDSVEPGGFIGGKSSEAANPLSPPLSGSADLFSGSTAPLGEATPGPGENASPLPSVGGREGGVEPGADAGRGIGSNLRDGGNPTPDVRPAGSTTAPDSPLGGVHSPVQGSAVVQGGTAPTSPLPGNPISSPVLPVVTFNNGPAIPGAIFSGQPSATPSPGSFLGVGGLDFTHAPLLGVNGIKRTGVETQLAQLRNNLEQQISKATAEAAGRAAADAAEASARASRQSAEQAARDAEATYKRLLAEAARNDNLGTNEDTPLTISIGDLLGNDSPPPGVSLSIKEYTQPNHGSVTRLADGSFLYTPVRDFHGADHFNYVVSDGRGGTDSARVTVRVHPANDAPVSADFAISLQEDGTYTFSPVDFPFTDLEGGKEESFFGIRIETLPREGSLLFNGADVVMGQTIPVAELNQLVFRPDSNEFGEAYASFGFRILDGESASDLVNTVTVNVSEVNDSPTSSDAILTFSEDTAYTFTATNFAYSDSEAGSALSKIMITSLPGVGTLTLAGTDVTLNQEIATADIGNLVFTPAANGNGAGYASIGYKVSDGINWSTTSSTLTFNVTAVNDAPFFASGVLHPNVDTFVKIETSSGTTIQNSNFGNSERLETDGEQWTAWGTSRTLIQPDLSLIPQNATDVTLKLYAWVGDVRSGYDTRLDLYRVTSPWDETSVTWQTKPTHDSSISYDTVFIPHNAIVGWHEWDITALVTGWQDGAFSNHGLVLVNSPNYSGGGYRHFYSSDYQGDITLRPVITYGAGSEVTVQEDTPHPFQVSDFPFSEVDEGASLSKIMITALPNAGTLTLSGVAVTLNQEIAAADIGNLVFTPGTDANGTDYASLQYKVSDGTAWSATANTLTFNVTAVSDTPTSSNATLTTNEDTAFTFSSAHFAFNDPDTGVALAKIMITSLPSAGTLTLSGQAVTLNQEIDAANLGHLVFSPVANANGASYASIDFKVSNGSAWSASANTLTFNVTAVNDAPFFSRGTLLPDVDTFVKIETSGGATMQNSNFGASDRLETDGEQWTAWGTSRTLIKPDLAQIPLNATDVTLKLYAWVGDSRSGYDTRLDLYRVTSSWDEASVTWETKPAYDATVSYDTVYIPHNAIIGWREWDITTLATGWKNGTFANHGLVIVNSPNYSGGGYRHFYSSDYQGDLSLRPVITYNGGTLLTTNEDSPYTFQASDFFFSDVDAGAALAKVMITALPTAGTLTLSGVAVTLNQEIDAANLGHLVFTPAANANGSGYASMGYKVSDGQAWSAASNTLTFDVTAVNDAPVLTNAGTTTALSGATPVGSEFQLNTYTSLRQDAPHSAALTNGGFVTVWQSEGQDGSDFGVYGQRFDASGAKVGSEFVVPTTTGGRQEDPAVTGLSNGGFFVSWQSETSPGNYSFDSHGQFFDASGNKSGAAFRLNTTTSGQQWDSRVIQLTGGDLVAVWISNGQDGSMHGVYGQRLDTSGTLLGSEFRVNTYTSNEQRNPELLSLNNGGFLVTWNSQGQDGSGWGIYNQHYDASGNAVGSEYRVNTTTTGNQAQPAATQLTNGHLLVTWNDFGLDGLEEDIHGQILDISGNKIGGELTLNNATPNGGGPQVQALPDGGFMLLWSAQYDTGVGYETYLRQFDASGTPRGDAFIANTTTALDQYADYATDLMALLSDGTLLTTWASNGQDVSNYNVNGQLFDLHTPRYVENAAPLTVDRSLTLADVDHANLTGATVQISAASYRQGEDVLSFTNQNGITGSWSAANGILTLSGSDSLANYQTALRSVTFSNSDATPTAGERTIQFTVSDGQNASNQTVAKINVIPTTGLTGNSQNDVINGTGHNDNITGSGGADTLTGSGGTDIFQYAAPTDGGASNVTLADVIMDFTPGSDKIQLSAAGFGNIGAMTSGSNYFEISWSGADKAALNTALSDGTIEALTGAADNTDYVAFLAFTDHAGGEDSAAYLLYDDDNTGANGMTVLTELENVTAAQFAPTDIEIV